MMGWGYYGGGWGGWFGMVFWWALIVLGIVFLVRWIVSQGQGGGTDASKRNAVDVLKERYARGEIDKKEFEEKKKDLIS